MSIETLIRQAKAMLRNDAEYCEDARRGIGTGNTVAGAALAMATGAPRQYAEAAVVEAVRDLCPEVQSVQEAGDATG